MRFKLAAVALGGILAIAEPGTEWEFLAGAFYLGSALALGRIITYKGIWETQAR